MSAPASLVGVGIVVFLVFIVTSLYVETRFLRSTAISLAEAEARYLGHHLGEMYFREGVLLDDEGKVPEGVLLPPEMLEDLKELQVTLIKIYDVSGRIIASSDPTYIGMEKGENSTFQAALSGQTVGHLASKKYYRDLYETDVTEDLLEIYVPLWTPATNLNAAVFEVYRPWRVYAPIVRAGLYRNAVRMSGLFLVFGITLLLVYRWVTAAVMKETVARAKLEGVVATAGAAAHHLNQPLTALTLRLEDIRNKYVDSEEEIASLLVEVDKLGATVRKITEVTEYRTTEHVSGDEIINIETNNKSETPAPSAEKS